jgi:hypothetical protein
MDKFNKSKIWKNKNVRRAIPLCVAILFYLIMTHLDLIGRGIAFLVNFILPVIVGIVLAYIMDPPIRNIEKKFSDTWRESCEGKSDCDCDCDYTRLSGDADHCGGAAGSQQCSEICDEQNLLSRGAAAVC